mgnify:CR=1 FL=1
MESTNDKVTIVAEIGVNHDGDLGKAKDLVLAAKDCGADFVKIQSFSPELLALPSTPKVAYQKQRDQSTSHFEMLSRLTLTSEQQEALKSFCDDSNVGFFSTPYDPSQVSFLASLGVPFMKVASADIIDLDLLHAISESGIPAIISTGMATQEEILHAVGILDLGGSPLTVLHAVSMYPTPPEHLRLQSIPHLQQLLGKPIGFSDHSESYDAAPIAVALGATMVEKHFTLNNSDPGPDHAASVNPEIFAAMVSAIRQAESMMTSHPEQLTETEHDMRAVSRKSWVTAIPLQRGTRISRNHLAARRPGNGIPVNQVELVLGKMVVRDLPAFHLLRADDLE